MIVFGFGTVGRQTGRKRGKKNKDSDRRSLCFSGQSLCFSRRSLCFNGQSLCFNGRSRIQLATSLFLRPPSLFQCLVSVSESTVLSTLRSGSIDPASTNPSPRRNNLFMSRNGSPPFSRRLTERGREDQAYRIEW